MTHRLSLVTTLLVLSVSTVLNAQADPWTRMSRNIETIITGPLVTSLSIVALVLGFLAMAFGEGGKRGIGVALFGIAGAVFATQVFVTLFT